MKKIFMTCAVMSCFCAGLHAQDIYKVEMLSGSDLDGDARYVGMGGAMSALGANLSAMGTNPASTGLYRRSDVSFTAGLSSQPDGMHLINNARELGPDKTRGFVNQAGMVYAIRTGNDSGLKFFNIGFNYKRARNFKQYIGLNGISTPNGLSQTWQMLDLAQDMDGYWLDLENEKDRDQTTPLTLLGYDTYLIDPVIKDNTIKDYLGSAAQAYNYRRAQWGGIHQYDINFSTNISERFYVGVTMGIYDVSWHNLLCYDEMLLDNQGQHFGNSNMQLEEHMTGVGFDGKVGIIVRPMEESPFRMGLSVTTPTAYDLETFSNLYLYSPYTDDDHPDGFWGEMDSNNKYRIRTPWKLNLSAATTVGNFLALDAEYELQNYSSAAVRYSDSGEYYYDDYYEGGWSSYSTDLGLQTEIKNWMRNVHTFRLGIEARPSSNFAVRAGYNFVSSPFDKDAYLNLLAEGPSYYYASNTDYVNLGETHRATLGLGYSTKYFYIDAAYQHQMQEATVYAFHYCDDGRFGVKNALEGQQLKLHRNNFQITLGVKF